MFQPQSIVPQNEDIMKRWLSAHYYEADVPEDIFDESTQYLPINPNPEYLRTIAILANDFATLPDPTWSVTVTDHDLAPIGMVGLYVLSEPPCTKEVHREDKGKVTRSAAYNNALLVSHNLMLAADGQMAAQVFNPFWFGAGQHTFTYNGRQWEVGTLKKILRDSGQWLTNTHPLFVAEGGSRGSDAQRAQRQQASAAGVAAYKAKALQRARTALAARENGATDLELAILLGISVASVPGYLTRARGYVADAAA